MTPSRLEGKVALVTGGARGIGRNIVKALSAEGARVLFADVDAGGAAGTLERFRAEGRRVDWLQIDLRAEGAPVQMVHDAVRMAGRLDILVNNARSGRRVGFLEEDDRTWEEGLSVTLKASFFATQEAVRVMSAGGGGSIVSIGSIAAFMACRESPVYHIAKAGLVQMTRYFAVHAGPHGVRVNAVLPGFIVQDEYRGRYEGEENAEYRRTAESCHPGGRTGFSDEVAAAVVFLCSQDAAFVNGHSLVVDGGATLQEQFGLLRRHDGKEK
ncbi:MAG: SDR family oxidoreductase [Planctomycetes bacterium]|nr:SDR family oxidoreductase [Planctomycetota bacterium]